MSIWPKDWEPPKHEYKKPTKSQITSIKNKIKGYVTEDRVYDDSEVVKELKKTYPQFINEDLDACVKAVQQEWHPGKNTLTP